MKTILLLVLVVLGCSACAPIQTTNRPRGVAGMVGERRSDREKLVPSKVITPAFRVASSRQVPHKFENGSCLAYSEVLPPLLQKAGATKIHRVLFQWNSGLSSGCHAVVAYSDSFGNWVADNENGAPWLTPGTTIQERITYFAKNCSGISNAQVIGDVIVR